MVSRLRFACNAGAAMLVAALAPGVLAQETAIRKVQSWSLNAVELPWSGASPPTHGLRLTLIAFAGTAWTPRAILDAARDMAPLVARCGVRITEANLHLLEAPARFRYYRTPVARELARLAPFPRPAIYFVEDTLNRPAFDAEAIGRSNSLRRPELADTVWVAAGTRDLPIALAHELVHVLMDSGEHSEEPDNLMRAETTRAHTRLTDAQCTSMLTAAERNGLLARLPN